jgi:hypothetical protein
MLRRLGTNHIDLLYPKPSLIWAPLRATPTGSRASR